MQDCCEFKPSAIVTSCLLETQEQGLGRVFTEHSPGGPLSRRMNVWLRFPCSQSKKAEPPIVARGVYNLKRTGYICSMCYCEGLKWEFCPCRILLYESMLEKKQHPGQFILPRVGTLAPSHPQHKVRLYNPSVIRNLIVDEVFQ